jgi:hypothetical protein
MKELFIKTFPNLDYRCLTSQDIRIRTNDASIHYKYEDNNDIYSWNYKTNTWKKNDESEKKQLIYLFDKDQLLKKFNISDKPLKMS